MAKKRSEDPRRRCSFACPSGHKFEAEPGRIEDAPERPWHPWAYFAPCPDCGQEAAQASWEVSIFKAHANATGPKTPEGKAASAANLEGHPTPEEAQLTRFNAVKHMMNARTASYFPAKPGKYPSCEHCEHLADETCLEYRACLKSVELFIRYDAAFESQNPNLLRAIHGDNQAALQLLLNQMFLAIAQDGGPRTVTPEWYYDKDGDFHLAKFTDATTGEEVQINKIEEHPLLKRLIEFIAKNNLTMADLEMTPKVQKDQELMEGFLTRGGDDQDSLEDFQAQIMDQQKLLMKLIESGQRKTDERVIDGEAEVVRGE